MQIEPRTEILVDTCIRNEMVMRVYVWEKHGIASSFEVFREATATLASVGHLTIERVMKGLLTMAPDRLITLRITPEARNALEHCAVDHAIKRLEGTFTRVAVTGK